MRRTAERTRHGRRGRDRRTGDGARGEDYARAMERVLAKFNTTISADDFEFLARLLDL